MSRESLNAADLIAAARRQARLEDFGDPALIEAIEVLAPALDREAGLTPAARETVRECLIGILRNRLRLHRHRLEAADAAVGPVRAPIVILGLPRTGSTFLHFLLARDPALRALRGWEIALPAPGVASEAERWHRIGLAAHLASLDRLAPGEEKLHFAGPALPEEGSAVLEHTLATYEIAATFDIPSYTRWLDGRDLGPTYAFHRQFLGFLQGRSPRRRWVLHAPIHLLGLAALIDQYPDAQVVQIHREPARCFASLAAFMRLVRRATRGDDGPPSLIEDWIDRWHRGLEAALGVRDSLDAAGSPARFVDVIFDDLVRDPISGVEALYGHLGLTLGRRARERMAAFVARHPSGEHGGQRYSSADLGIDSAAVRERFAAYRARFGIPDEGDPS